MDTRVSGNDGHLTIHRSSAYEIRMESDAIRLVRLSDHASACFSNGLKTEIEEGMKYLNECDTDSAEQYNALFDQMCKFYSELLIKDFAESEV